jgi:hypothetical protein
MISALASQAPQAASPYVRRQKNDRKAQKPMEETQWLPKPSM